MNLSEYVTNTLYKDGTVTIGTNTNDKLGIGASILIGHENDWVVLDKKEIKKIAGVLGNQFDKSVLNVKMLDSKKEILLSQENDTICVNKLIFLKYLVNTRLS